MVVVSPDYQRDSSLAVGTAHTVVSRQPVSGVRKNITITNTSPGAQKITVVKGVGLAVSGSGIVLAVGGSWSDATVNENSKCFQGTISVIGDGAGATVGVSEEME